MTYVPLLAASERSRIYMRHLLTVFLTLCSLCAEAAPEEERMGLSLAYPACQSVVTRMECRVGSFSSPRGNKVPRAERVLPLSPMTSPPNIFYMQGNRRVSIEQYFSAQKTTGLLVLKNNQIVFEAYQYARRSDMPMRSFSMSKTIIAILVGIAHEKKIINSLDDLASKYYGEINGSAYGATTIRNLLRMSSGVKFDEDYDLEPQSDLMKFNIRLNDPNKGKQGPIEAFNLFNVRQAQQGTIFHYASIENAVLTRVLTHATKRSITQLTKEWLWDHIGAESDAFWLTSPADKVENGAGGFYATVRDWGRLGLLLANDGKVGEVQIVPREYLIQATDPEHQDELFKPRHATNYFGYGFQTWIFPMKERSFAMLGIYGQSVFVQPRSGIVMVETSVYDHPSGDSMLRAKFDMWKGILVALGGEPIKDVMQAIDLGVQGLVSKDKPKEFLDRCIRAVHNGNKWLDEDLAMKAVTHLLERKKNGNVIEQLLTTREMAVAKLVTEGWPNKRIASKLSISEGTAKLHLHHIYQKLNCSGRMALVLHMQKNGLA